MVLRDDSKLLLSKAYSGRCVGYYDLYTSSVALKDP